MRRTAILAFALTVPLVAYAGAATTTKHPKVHHATVHHPKPHRPKARRPKPAITAGAKANREQMRAEAAHSRYISKVRTHENEHLRVAHAKERATKKEAKRRDRTARKSSHKSSKTVPAPGNTVGESRLEMERRRAEALRAERLRAERLQADELKAHYDEGYKAGYEAGLEAARKERVSACVERPADTPRDYGPRRLASATPESRVPAGADATTAASDAAAASVGDDGLAPADRMAQNAESEPTSLEMIPGAHQPPVTLQASMRMLHERMPPPLRGSLASLERQNERLEAEGLQRIEDNSDLESRIAHGLLVPLPVSEGLTVNPSLPDLRRYCRPWTAEFLSDLAEMHDAVFHKPLQVDSAVRTVDYQERLMRINGNAAPAQGNIVSPHETGATIDIGKRGMTWREISWMRHYLLTLQDSGLIDVEEEFRQACFHITVYDTYGRMQPAQNTAGTGTSYEHDRGSDTASVQPGDSNGQ